jgi:hypothetical protein
VRLPALAAAALTTVSSQLQVHDTRAVAVTLTPRILRRPTCVDMAVLPSRFCTRLAAVAAVAAAAAAAASAESDVSPGSVTWTDLLAEPCNMTAWRLLCKPAPTNTSACMQCCGLHGAELWKLNCIGSDCWPDYCAGKPASGCHSPSPPPSPSPPAYYKLKPESFAGVLGSDYNWAVSSIPLFESANRTLDNVYYFRWRTYKSHIHSTGIDAFPWVVTEFSPNVSWGGAFNTINGDAGAHLSEAGWLRGSDGRAVLDSISRWWAEAGLHPGWMPAPGTRKTYIKYYYWYAVALKRNFDKTGNKTLLEKVLPAYKTQFMQFTTGAAPGDQQMVLPIDQQGSECLYNVPGNDAQEAAISGPGCRPLVQSTMYGEAAALAEMFAAIGNQSSAAEMAAEADKWQRRVLQQWNAELSSFDTIHPAVAPMPPGWNAVPVPAKRLCNATLLFQGFELRGGCTKRCIANADCRFMTFNDANDWCTLTQYCNSTLPLNGLGFPSIWEKPASDSVGGSDDAGVTPQFEPFKTAVFCCDQSPCVKGESTFLFQGAASRAECEAKCLANARCRFITSTGLSPTDWCMNAEYCNTTNPFGGKKGDRAAVTLQLKPGAQGPGWSFAGVRELASLTSPWLFSAVPRVNASAYAHSWDTAFDPEGLGGPNGLRTAEKRHPDYFCDAGCCSWAGPVWPYETAKGISAAINVLNRYPEVTTLDGAKFWSMLGDYTTMHTSKWKVMSSSSTFYSNLSSSPVAKYLMDGLGELWVAENGCGDERWTRQTNLGGPAWTDTPTNGYRCESGSQKS